MVVGAPSEASSATGVNGNGSNNSAPRSGAAYVFARSGTTWTQQAYLKASNTDADDQFGTSLAVSGDTVVVGAPAERSNATGVNGDQSNNSLPNAGAAYVFFYQNGPVTTGWTQRAYLKASDADANDNFAASVAVSDGTVVVGVLGEDSNATGVNGDSSNNSGTNSGAAYVFARGGTSNAPTWSFQYYLKASNAEANDFFGKSVAVSGDLVVVGAHGESSNALGINGDQSNNSVFGSGAAYVFGPPLLAAVLTIVGSGPGQATISWTPPLAGVALQETLSLSALGWSNSPTGETNPITIPFSAPTKFFRLFKP